MSMHSTGTAIVERIAAGRPWWRLGAADVRAWMASLPESLRESDLSCSDWVGEPWDGKSAIQLGDDDKQRTAVSAADIRYLLQKLEQRIGEEALPGLVAPDRSSVRRVLGRGAHPVLAFDFDFGDFMLPLCINSDWAYSRHQLSMADIVVLMIQRLRHASACRLRIIDREARMRRALVETTDRIGEGAAPLWLRLEPYPCSVSDAHLLGAPYGMVMATLAEGPVWAPTTYCRVWTMKQIRTHHSLTWRDHREKAAQLRLQDTTWAQQDRALAA